MQRIHILVFGDVQGVFYRANTVSTATKLGISGFVRNRPDGSVEVIAEGEKEKLEQLLSWCHHGPAGASVSRVEHEWEEVKSEFDCFRVRYS